MPELGVGVSKARRAGESQDSPTPACSLRAVCEEVFHAPGEGGSCECLSVPKDSLEPYQLSPALIPADYDLSSWRVNFTPKLGGNS